MKRELKGDIPETMSSSSVHRKAHPDEKGTESLNTRTSDVYLHHRKAHPDEKGTERYNIGAII